MCVCVGGASSWHSPLPRGGLLGRSWPVLTCSPKLRLQARGSSNFLRWESSVGRKRWGFSESTVGGEGVSPLAVARALRVHAACEQTAAVCRENADCVYFSPEPAGSGGGGAVRRGGGGSPARPRLNFRAEETSGVPHFHLCLPSPALGLLPGSCPCNKRRACWGSG